MRTDSGYVFLRVSIHNFVNILMSQLFRDNLVFLQVGFKSLGYEMQKQQPAYDSNSLFGENLILRHKVIFVTVSCIRKLVQYSQW